jgi:membrane-associated protease RseP (regulator of RpoE activity)
MHFLLALMLIFTVHAAYGEWHPTLNVDVATGPALAAGIQKGDRLVALDGQQVESFEAMTDYVKARPGEPVVVTLERDGLTKNVEVTLADHRPDQRPDDGPVGFLGIGPAGGWNPAGPIESIGKAVSDTRSAMWQSIAGIGDLFSPSGVSNYIGSVRDAGSSHNGGSDGTPQADRPSSVIGIVQVGGDIAQQGFVDLLYLLFVVNVFIGVFNLTPLLPFDGGHVVIATYEKVRSMISGREYRADVGKLMPLTYVVVALLAVLFVTTAFMDIVDPISIN